VSNVLIAYFNETWWLVHGVDHLDDMLSGAEAADLTIQMVTCKTFAEVMRLWDEAEDGKMPWAINPKIIERLKTRPATTSI